MIKLDDATNNTDLCIYVTSSCPSIFQPSVMDTTVHKRDVQVLAGLGYKQELQRAFTPLEVFGIAFSIIGLVPSIA